MVYHTTTVEVNSGKNAAMMDWSQKMVAFISEHLNQEVTVLRNIGASNQQVHFLSIHESLASYEEYVSSLTANEQFWALVRKADEQSLWSRNSDRLFRSFS
jgi:hypothetical protein